jgi:hypothetical protein
MVRDKKVTVEGGATRGTTAPKFITENIAANIQGVYKGGTVHPTGLTVNQGCSQVST